MVLLNTLQWQMLKHIRSCRVFLTGLARNGLPKIAGFPKGGSTIHENMLSTAACWLVQIRRKGDNENLAEWVVDVTTEADRQGSDSFVSTFQRCGTCNVLAGAAATSMLPMHALSSKVQLG